MLKHGRPLPTKKRWLDLRPSPPHCLLRPALAPSCDLVQGVAMSSTAFALIRSSHKRLYSPSPPRALVLNVVRNIIMTHSPAANGLLKHRENRAAQQTFSLALIHELSMRKCPRALQPQRPAALDMLNLCCTAVSPIYIYVYVCIYIYIYKYEYTYIHIHMHTHTHTHAQTHTHTHYVIYYIYSVPHRRLSSTRRSPQ